MVHEAAATGFARSAGAYERGRPAYPPAAVAWLVARLGLARGATVVDLAAGTGKLTRPLLAAGLHVVAVEPVAEMRAALPARARAVDGTAEAMPLAAASADAVTVAQAFHWFDGDRALAEIHRVLRPGGGLGLVWNRRVLEDPVQAALHELMAPYRGDTPAHAAGTWREPFARTTLFEALEERTFSHVQRLDAAGLADRVGSVSFIAALSAAERARVRARARALAGGGDVELPYVCEVFVCFRRA
ncbi:MAG TPA: class I SAM-dependent methyltransferase [Solirubrobacteraceae bacterium]|nr:class I SAM-dependent methyltransferase [Solirubrobacteraceae bacterium]